jgi:hypothetical protein
VLRFDAISLDVAGQISIQNATGREAIEGYSVEIEKDGREIERIVWASAKNGKSPDTDSHLAQAFSHRENLPFPAPG